MALTAFVRADEGCRLLLVESAWEATETGFDEALEITLVAREGCGGVDFGLPGGARLVVDRAVERRGDGIKVPLDDTRWSATAPDPDGNRVARLALPDLLGGDKVHLRLRRERLPAWTAFEAPGADAKVVDGAPAAPSGAPEPSVAAVIGPRTRRLTLRIPGGDPQITLHPGGAADAKIEDSVVVGPSEVARVWMLEAPPDAPVELRAEPDGIATLERVGGFARVRLAPFEGPTRLTVTWLAPDPPVHGETGDLALLDLQSEPGDAKFRREGDRWALESVGDRWILPNRDVLVKSLDRRFRAAALPEPGLPLELRGAPASEEILAAILPTLRERTPLLADGDPLFPRRLHLARKSGAVTPLEATLTAWLYADQLRFEAWWALARPASTETLPDAAPDPASPSGYDVPLLVVRLGERDLWIDPGCGSCAPFELRPDLEGARILSPSGRTRTPPPTEGELRVEVAGDEVVWTASGPPALLLREELARIPSDQRPAALAARVAGPGAILRDATGLGDAGAPVRVVARIGTGLVPDPTALPAPDDDGTVYVAWLGPRTLVRGGVETTYTPPSRVFVPPEPPPPPPPAEPPGEAEVPIPDPALPE